VESRRRARRFRSGRYTLEHTFEFIVADLDGNRIRVFYDFGTAP
jgi:hypothetical protein